MDGKTLRIDLSNASAANSPLGLPYCCSRFCRQMHSKCVVEVSLVLARSIVRCAACALYSYSMHFRLIFTGSSHAVGLCVGLTSCGWFSTVPVHISTSWAAACARYPRVTPGHLSETLRCVAVEEGAFDLMDQTDIQKTMRNL